MTRFTRRGKTGTEVDEYLRGENSSSKDHRGTSAEVNTFHLCGAPRNVHKARKMCQECMGRDWTKFYMYSEFQIRQLHCDLTLLRTPKQAPHQPAQVAQNNITPFHFFGVLAWCSCHPFPLVPRGFYMIM